MSTQLHEPELQWYLNENYFDLAALIALVSAKVCQSEKVADLLKNEPLTSTGYMKDRHEEKKQLKAFIEELIAAHRGCRTCHDSPKCRCVTSDQLGTLTVFLSTLSFPNRSLTSAVDPTKTNGAVLSERLSAVRDAARGAPGSPYAELLLHTLNLSGLIV